MHIDIVKRRSHRGTTGGASIAIMLVNRPNSENGKWRKLRHHESVTKENPALGGGWENKKKYMNIIRTFLLTYRETKKCGIIFLHFRRQSIKYEPYFLRQPEKVTFLEIRLFFQNHKSTNLAINSKNPAGKAGRLQSRLATIRGR